MEQPVPSVTDGPKELKRTRFQILLSKLTHNWMGTIGLVMFVIVLVIAVFASRISPYDPYAVINATTSDVMGSPSAAHPLGQDESGKDVLSEVFYGARVSLLIGITASLIVVVLGGFLGTVAGYFSGTVDTIIMRIVDAILVVPQLPLMLVIIAVAGQRACQHRLGDRLPFLDIHGTYRQVAGPFDPGAPLYFKGTGDWCGTHPHHVPAYLASSPSDHPGASDFGCFLGNSDRSDPEFSRTWRPDSDKLGRHAKSGFPARRAYARSLVVLIPARFGSRLGDHQPDILGERSAGDRQPPPKDA